MPAAGPPPSPIAAALRGLCPACGAPTLFAGPVRFADRCPSCGLDLAGFNVGDGPAAFLTLLLGALVAGGAIAVELLFSPPWWVHLAIWPVLTLALLLGALRLSKGLLLALEYRTAAREGRIGRPS